MCAKGISTFFLIVEFIKLVQLELCFPASFQIIALIKNDNSEGAFVRRDKKRASF